MTATAVKGDPGVKPQELGYTGETDEGWLVRRREFSQDGTHEDGSWKEVKMRGWQVVMTAGWHGPLLMAETYVMVGHETIGWNCSIQQMYIEPESLHHLADLLQWLQREWLYR